MKRIVLCLLALFVCASGQTPYYYTADSTKGKDGKTRHRFYGSPVYYKDAGRYRAIDTKMSFDAVLRVWAQNKAPYRSDLPEYADDWFCFVSDYEGANYQIKARPVADHVRGGLSDDLMTVTYLNAFGDGADLIVTAGNGGMTKLIKLRSVPKGLNRDLNFDFELDLPIRSEAFNGSGGKESLHDLTFTGESLSLKKDGKGVYFGVAQMWDSAERALSVPVNISIRTVQNRVILRKTIPADYIQRARLPIYTDHPTSYDPAGNGDGYVYARAQDTYSNVRGYSTGYSSVYTGSDGYLVESYVDADVSPREITILRGFCNFDLSALSGTVSAATVYLAGYAKGTGENNSYAVVHCVAGTQSSVTSLSVSDYNDAGGTSFASKTISSCAISGTYNGWELNSSGISHVEAAKGGSIKFGFRVGNDFSNSQSGDYYDPSLRVYYNEDASYKPYIEVTVTSSYSGAIIMMGE